MLHTRSRILAGALGAALVLGPGSLPAWSGGSHQHGHGPSHGNRVSTVLDGLDGPRGIESIAPGTTLISESDGSFSLVVERRRRAPRVIELGSVPGGFAPAVSAGRWGEIFIVTGASGPDGSGGALHKWRPGWPAPRLVADLAAYQAGGTDPDDLEGLPEESNPYDVLALRDGTVLVADAAGNDLLRVDRRGRVQTVARFKPRVVEMPAGLPETDPEGNPLPPAGTPMPSESVPTSITVGKDGYWYVSELRGFPATPGTSQIWRIRPGAVGAVCDPERPWKGACTRYADGLTSVVDLATGRDGSLYALALSRMSWLAMEIGAPGAEIGGLFRVDRRSRRITELARDRLIMPGGVAASRDGSVYVTGPVFGPGALLKIR